MKMLTTTLLLCLGVLMTAVSAGLAQDNLLGAKWKLNLEKSKFNPGPAPRSSVLNYEAAEGGFKVTTEGVNAEGNPTKGSFGPYKLDGKPYPVAGVAAYDASSFKMIDERTAEIVRLKGDKTVQTAKRVLSADGKTLTFTSSGINARGEQFNDVAVFDRQ
jgi:hypothetical protein